MTTKIQQRVRTTASPLGKEIIRLADIANLSVPDVARLVDLDHTTIYKAICNPSWAPRPRTHDKLQAFGVSETQLSERGIADGSHRRRGWHPCRKCGESIPSHRTYCSQGCFDDEWQVRLPPAAFRDSLRKKVVAAINASGLKVYPWAEQHGLHAQNFANWLRDPERKLYRRNLVRLAAPLGLSEEETVALAGGAVEEWRAKRIQELRMPPPKLRRHLNRIRQIPRSAAARAAISKRQRGKPAAPGQMDATIRISRSLSGRLRQQIVMFRVNHGHYPVGKELRDLALYANEKYQVGNLTFVQAEMKQAISRLSGGKARRGRKAYYDHLEICKRRRVGEAWAVIAQAVAVDATQGETIRPAHALWHSRKKIPPCLTPARP